MTADPEKSLLFDDIPEPQQPNAILMEVPPQTDELTAASDSVAARPVIHLIEDDPAVREAARDLFEGAGWDVRDHFSAEEFLLAPRPSGDACLLVDVMLPGMNGVALLKLLRTERLQVPVIMLTGRDDSATAVTALKAGADDFIEKPADAARLLASVVSAMERARDVRARNDSRAQAQARLKGLTPRESDVLMMVVDGAPNKIIAAEFGINQRTVENHRASVMRKTGAPSLPDLVRLFLVANGVD